MTKAINPVASWLTKNIDFKTMILLVCLIGQTVFIYTTIVDRLNNIDERLKTVEKSYISKQDAELKAQLREEQFRSIQHALDRQEDSIAELRGLMEVPLRMVLPSAQHSHVESQSGQER